MAQRFGEVRNLGPVSAAWLREIGVETLAELADLGVVEAYRRVKAVHPKASLNLLYAMQAALLDLPWQKLPAELKDQLKAGLGQDHSV